MKIGVLGGTFNPIHKGHIELAKAALLNCGLDQIWIMPAGNPYMKNSELILDADIRYSMIQLAIEDIPNFSICTMELFDDEPTYSYLTFSRLEEDFPEHKFYFILGADSVLNLDKWKEPARLLACCDLIVSTRNMPDMSLLEKKCHNLQVSYGAVIHILPYMNIEISSSDIRERLSKGLDVSELLPEKVLAYIEEKGLYK